VWLTGDVLVWRDQLRDSLRSLRRDVRSTLLAISLLAVTIGAITAIYAIVHAVVLRPFGFVDQERLAIIWQRDDRRALPIIEVAYGDMQDWAARSRSFTSLAVIGSVNWSLTLGGSTEPQQVPMAGVSASFFPVMGVAPAIGRGLQPADEQGNRPRVMLISHGLWVRRFGSDPSIVGRAVPTLDGDGSVVPLDVVGVMPADFDFPRGADAWVPAAPIIRQSGASFGGADNALRFLNVFFAVGRLRDGIPSDDAARELTRVMRTADRAGGPEPPQSVLVTPIASYLLGPAGPVLRTLLAGSALMLIIACANVAGLQVARATRRHRALAVRVALGASGSHLVRQILMESSLVTACALVGGLALGVAIERTLIWLAPAEVPRLTSVTLFSGPVMAFGAVAAFVTVGLCALWPVLVAQRIDAVSVLAHGRDAGTPRGRLVQRAIVIAQLAIALTLVAGTGLFLRTVRGLDRTTLGFDPEGLGAFTLTPQTNDTARWNAVYDAVIARLVSLPQVTGAAGVLNRPLNGPIGWDTQPIYPGQLPADPNTWGLNPHINLEVVTPGYLKTMGIRLVRGRWFTAQDTTSAPGVVVVGESMARRMWPGRDPIGERIFEPTYRNAESDRPKGVWQTVVGVVEDVRYRGLNDVRLDVYLPSTQSRNVPTSLMVRTTGDANVLTMIRAAVRQVDPAAQVAEAVSMRAAVDAESAPWRFLVRVFVAFAVLAAALAAVGLGAVIAMTVTARRRELAIRAALGADRGRLRRLVLGDALVLVGLGVTAGLCGALTLGRAVAHVLINVPPHDALAMTSATAIAAATGLAASWIPARRASDADPIEAMRAE
jgi:putative ABC transport system permease protein